MAKQYWLVKSEPESFSWQDFAAEGTTQWTGVRNYQARINLRGMKKGDQVLFYHSGSGKEVVGVARVLKGGYPEPGAEEWVCVDLEVDHKLPAPVTLQAIKSDKKLGELLLLRNTRLSVMPVTEEQFQRITGLAT
jgi:predicted RNA-binding protein with PUA-like domain